MRPVSMMVLTAALMLLAFSGRDAIGLPSSWYTNGLIAAAAAVLSLTVTRRVFGPRQPPRLER